MNSEFRGMPQARTFGNPNVIRQVFFSHLPLIKDRKNMRTEVISNVIKSGIYFEGPQNKILEKKLSRMLSGSLPARLAAKRAGRQGYITTLASGHDALILALAALNLKKEDEVIFPVNAYPTAFPVALSGAKPVPCDVNLNGQMDIGKLTNAINKNSRAVITVHLYGMTGDIDKIRKICHEKKVVLIEDCAQSLGTKFGGKPLGTFGEISCFSFYPTKNLGSLGDGGAIWTKNRDYYNYFLKAKSYGERTRYDSEFVSGHSRLPEVQAAILNLYTKMLPRYFRKRKLLFQLYQEKLELLFPRVRVLKSDQNSDPVPHILVIDVDKRDKLAAYLAKKEIPTLIHYPKPIHLVKAFSYLGFKRGDFPMAERLSKRILSLPFHPLLSEGALEQICATIKEFYVRSEKLEI